MDQFNRRRPKGGRSEGRVGISPSAGEESGAADLEVTAIDSCDRHDPHAVDGLLIERHDRKGG